MTSSFRYYLFVTPLCNPCQVPSLAPSAQPIPKVCPKCNLENLPIAKFCRKCGAKLE
ncbi:zinc-ribbon domain-containing protein [Candidatus Bathyarchaeota archaeon]|nr:zinc-ribbon domain-containing protein [Candidatus Bathyarchaeota archaeon]